MRRWLFAEVAGLREFDPRAPAFVYTIDLDRQATGSLLDADLTAIKKRIDMRLRRCGMAGAMIIGGIEVAWKQTIEEWIVHAHVLVIGATDEQRSGLREEFGDGQKSLLEQPLNDLTEQASYLLKFVDYHRPKERTGARKARAFPLPIPRKAELLAWRKVYRQEDFLLLFGCRRRGSFISKQQNSAGTGGENGYLATLATPKKWPL